MRDGRDLNGFFLKADQMVILINIPI